MAVQIHDSTNGRNLKNKSQAEEEEDKLHSGEATQFVFADKILGLEEVSPLGV